MKAVVVEKQGGPAVVVNGRPLPRLRPNGYMLVRTKTIALNPADVAIIDWDMGPPNSLIGCDYAGVVEEVGPGVHRDFKKGDRVCGAMRAGDPREVENGTAAELICVKADMTLSVPESVSGEDASTVGVTVLTTGRCLYQKFGLSWPDKPEPNSGWLFVNGGSSAMGTMIIQFAELSKDTVVTTSSPRNFTLCKSYGADHAFNYNDPATPTQIKSLTGTPSSFA